MTTQSDHDQPIAPNLLERDFTAEAPDRVRVGDHLRLDHRGLDVLGRFHRRLLSRELAIEALPRAIELRKPAPAA